MHLSLATNVINPGAPFDAPRFNRQLHTLAWRLLGRRLRSLRQSGGLGVALQALLAQQCDSGFIKDALDQVVTRRVADPAHSWRSFAVQYNPRRALRLKGAGRSEPPAGTESRHAGCFLDRENVQWQQWGAELGMDLAVNDRNYVAWPNPFPLKPLHLTIASAGHGPQSWIGANLNVTAERLHTLLDDLLGIVGECPGFIGFHNGVGAGASIAGHFHFQLFHRVSADERFALEIAASGRMSGSSSVLCGQDYPVAALCFSGPRAQVLAQALDWGTAWARHNGNRACTTGNFVASASTQDSDRIALYFVPRLGDAPVGGSALSRVGGLELLGEWVLTDPAEQQALLDGQFGFGQVWNRLLAVKPRGVEAFAACMAGRL